MEQSGLPGGRELRALVFLTIASTVLLHGATADLVARALGVRLPNRDGIAVLGAEGLALMLARVLRDAGRRVVLIDANPDHCHRAEQEGFTVVFGNGLEERTLTRARLEQAKMVIGGTANEEANSLFAREARELFGVRERYVAVNRNGAGVTAALLAAPGKPDALRSRQGSRSLGGLVAPARHSRASASASRRLPRSSRRRTETMPSALLPIPGRSSRSSGAAR